MDDSGWPAGLLILAALLLTALLARLASINNSLSRAAAERLRDEQVARANLMLWLFRPRNMLAQTILFAQMTAFAVGGLSAVGLTLALLESAAPLPVLILAPLLIYTFLYLAIYNLTPPYRREESSDRPLPILVWVLVPVHLAFLLPALLLQKLQSLIVSEDDSRAMKEEEILQMVQSETEEGTLEEEEREMIEGVFEFGDTTVREIMIPRIDIICAEVNTSSEDLLKLIQEFRHSRIPIYEERVDHIKGVIYAKDLLHALSVNEPIDIPKIMRPPYFVPENKKIDELLREFKTARVHIAIVVDEYGGTSGLVTLEDVIEEIVGEIQDEYDEEEQLFHWTEDGQMLVADARIDIEDLNLLLNVELPQDGYETLGGFIYNHLGHVPDPKETFQYDRLEMHIVEVIGQRITHVQIRKRVDVSEPAEDKEAAEAGADAVGGSQTGEIA